MFGDESHTEVVETDDQIVVTTPMHHISNNAAFIAFMLVFGAFFIFGLVRAKSLTDVLETILFFALIILPTSLNGAWQAFGKEVVEICVDGITIKQVLAGRALAHHCRAAEINGVFVARHPFPWRYEQTGVTLFNFTIGRVAIGAGRDFLGGIRTYRFGAVLSPGEAAWLVDAIHAKFPQYIYHAK